MGFGVLSILFFVVTFRAMRKKKVTSSAIRLLCALLRLSLTALLGTITIATQGYRSRRWARMILPMADLIGYSFRMNAEHVCMGNRYWSCNLQIPPSPRLLPLTELKMLIPLKCSSSIAGSLLKCSQFLQQRESDVFFAPKISRWNIFMLLSYPITYLESTVCFAIVIKRRSSRTAFLILNTLILT